MYTNEQMLKVEIEFWRSMIEAPEAGTTQLATERMIQAYKLAERKLLMIQEESPNGEPMQ
jgi:hypothetical protein